MGDDLNSYKQAVTKAANKWTLSMRGLKDKPEFKKMMDQLEEAKEIKQPSADDKKKMLALQTGMRNYIEKQMDSISDNFGRELQKMPAPETAAQKKYNQVRDEVLKKVGDGIEIGDVTLSADLSWDSKSRSVDSVNVSLSWDF
jgi:hypothetical protein